MLSWLLVFLIAFACKSSFIFSLSGEIQKLSEAHEATRSCSHIQYRCALTHLTATLPPTGRQVLFNVLADGCMDVSVIQNDTITGFKNDHSLIKSL